MWDSVKEPDVVQEILKRGLETIDDMGPRHSQ